MHIHKVVASTSEWISVIEGLYTTKVIDWGDAQYRLNAFATGNSAFGVSLAVIMRDDVRNVACSEQLKSLVDAQGLVERMFGDQCNFVQGRLDCAFSLGAAAEDTGRPSIGALSFSAVAG